MEHNRNSVEGVGNLFFSIYINRNYIFLSHPVIPCKGLAFRVLARKVCPRHGIQLFARAV